MHAIIIKLTGDKNACIASNYWENDIFVTTKNILINPIKISFFLTEKYRGSH